MRVICTYALHATIYDPYLMAGATPRCTAEHSTDPAAGSDAATCHGADEVRWGGDSEVSTGGIFCGKFWGMMI